MGASTRAVGEEETQPPLISAMSHDDHQKYVTWRRAVRHALRRHFVRTTGIGGSSGRRGNDVDGGTDDVHADSMMLRDTAAAALQPRVVEERRRYLEDLAKVARAQTLAMLRSHEHTLPRGPLATYT